jgi:hypothetical protein
MEQTGEGIGTRLARWVFLAAAVACAAINGSFFSPLFDPIFFLIRPFAPAFLSYLPNSLLYFTSLMIALVTLSLAGVPAAIYERIRRLPHSTPGSLLIWALVSVGLAYPALRALVSGD